MKYYNLKKWDRAKHWDELLTFQKLDWMYAHFLNKNWQICIGHSYEYEKQNGIYYPVIDNT